MSALMGVQSVDEEERSAQTNWGSPPSYFLPNSIVDFTLTEDLDTNLNLNGSSLNNTTTLPITTTNTTTTSIITSNNPAPPLENIWSISAPLFTTFKIPSSTSNNDLLQLDPPQPQTQTDNVIHTTTSTNYHHDPIAPTPSPFFNSSSPISNSESPLSSLSLIDDDDDSMFFSSSFLENSHIIPPTQQQQQQQQQPGTPSSNLHFSFTSPRINANKSNFSSHIHAPISSTIAPPHTPSSNTHATSPRSDLERSIIPPTLHQDNIRSLSNPTWKNTDMNGYFDPSTYTVYVRPTSIPTPTLVPEVAPPPTSSSLPAFKTPPHIYELNGMRPQDGVVAPPSYVPYVNPTPVVAVQPPTTPISRPENAVAVVQQERPPPSRFIRTQPSKQDRAKHSQLQQQQAQAQTQTHSHIPLHTSPSSHPFLTRSFTDAPKVLDKLQSNDSALNNNNNNKQYTFTPATPSMMITTKVPLLSRPKAFTGNVPYSPPLQQQQQQHSTATSTVMTTSSINSSQPPNNTTINNNNNNSNTNISNNNINSNNSNSNPTNNTTVDSREGNPSTEPQKPLPPNSLLPITSATPAGAALLPTSSAQYPVWPLKWNNYQPNTKTPFSPYLIQPQPVPYTAYKKPPKKLERLRSFTTGQINDYVAKSSDNTTVRVSRSYVTVTSNPEKSESIEANNSSESNNPNFNNTNTHTTNSVGNTNDNTNPLSSSNVPQQSQLKTPRSQLPNNQVQKIEPTNTTITSLLSPSQNEDKTHVMNQNPPLPTPNPIVRRTTTYTTTITTTITTIIPDIDIESQNNKHPPRSLTTSLVNNSNDIVQIIDSVNKDSNSENSSDSLNPPRLEGNRPRKGVHLNNGINLTSSQSKGKNFKGFL